MFYFGLSHSYTLYGEIKNKKRPLNHRFMTRELAREYMYNYCHKKGLVIIKIYNDKHDKTYFCQDGSVFHINRV